MFGQARLALLLQVLHVRQERAPQHAEETGKNDLILDRNERKVERLHDRPVDGSDAVRVEELGAHLSHRMPPRFHGGARK